MFPGAGASPGSVWTAIRPHNWRPTTTKEWLVELDMVTGAPSVLVVQQISVIEHDCQQLAATRMWSAVALGI